MTMVIFGMMLEKIADVPAGHERGVRTTIESAALKMQLG